MQDLALEEAATTYIVASTTGINLKVMQVCGQEHGSQCQMSAASPDTALGWRSTVKSTLIPKGYMTR